MSETSARRGIPRILWVAAFLVTGALIALAYTNLKNTAPPATGGDLEKIGEVPDFRLADQTGRPVTREDLKGKIWVANFIFTRCKGPCPLSSQRMSELNTKLKKARGDVELISFTVDPVHDTPAVLATYGASLGADPANWKFLTGTPEDIQSIVVKGLLQPIAKEPDGTPAHSTRFVIVDANGWLRGYHDGLDPEAVQKLMVDIGELLRENPPSKK